MLEVRTVMMKAQFKSLAEVPKLWGAPHGDTRCWSAGGGREFFVLRIPQHESLDRRLVWLWWGMLMPIGMPC
jgi:hypothetical protein